MLNNNSHSSYATANDLDSSVVPSTDALFFFGKLFSNIHKVFRTICKNIPFNKILAFRSQVAKTTVYKILADWL